MIVTRVEPGTAIRVIAWLVIATCLVEWFPFFLQVLLNFFNMNLRSMPPGELPAILAIVASPLVSLVLCATASRFPAVARRIMPAAAMVLLGATAVLAWLAFAAYYQFYPVFAPDFMGHVTPNSDMFGYLGYLNQAPKELVYATNAIMFYGLVPVLHHVASGGEHGRVVVNRDTRVGMLLAAVYMCLRPGGIAGVPFRISMMCLLALGACLVVLVLSGGKVEDPAPRPGDIVAAAIPKWAMAGLAILVAFPLFAFPGMVSALVDATWVWAFLAAGLVVAGLLEKKAVLLTTRVATAFIIAMMAMQVPLILSTVEPALFSIHAWLQAISLFLLGVFPVASAPLLARARANRFLVHPARQWWFFMTGVFAGLLPLLLGLLPPLTTWAGLILVCMTSGLGLVAMLAARRRDAPRVEVPSLPAP